MQSLVLTGTCEGLFLPMLRLQEQKKKDEEEREQLLLAGVPHALSSRGTAGGNLRTNGLGHDMMT